MGIDLGHQKQHGGEIVIRVNLGSGHWKLDGWINVDLDMESLPAVCADLSAKLPFRSGTVDLMHTEDFIDQLELDQAHEFLRECHRVLRPGGVVRVLTPDMGELARLYLHDRERLDYLWNEYVRVPLELGTPGEIFNVGMRFAGHTFLYDAETFTAMASACGFEARQTTFNESDIEDLRGLDLRSPEDSVSMYFDCYKRDL